MSSRPARGRPCLGVETEEETSSQTDVRLERKSLPNNGAACGSSYWTLATGKQGGKITGELQGGGSNECCWPCWPCWPCCPVLRGQLQCCVGGAKALLTGSSLSGPLLILHWWPGRSSVGNMEVDCFQGTNHSNTETAPEGCCWEGTENGHTRELTASSLLFNLATWLKLRNLLTSDKIQRKWIIEGTRCVLKVLVQMPLLHLCGVAGHPNELESRTQQKYQGPNTSSKTPKNIDVTKHRHGKCGWDDLGGKWIPTNKEKKDMEFMSGGSQTCVKKKLSRRVCNGYSSIAMIRHCGQGNS